jgi:hypothetical protein
VPIQLAWAEKQKPAMRTLIHDDLPKGVDGRWNRATTNVVATKGRGQKVREDQSGLWFGIAGFLVDDAGCVRCAVIALGVFVVGLDHTL